MKKLSLSLGVLAIVAVLSSESKATTQYYVTDLGTLNRHDQLSQPCGINNNGQVVGDSTGTDYQFHAFLYTGSTMRDLGTLDGTESCANSINDKGQVVGEYRMEDGQYRAFLYNNSTMTDLGTLGETNAVAKGINNNGQIVGYSWSTDGNDSHAFMYCGSTITDLGTLGGTYSRAYDINKNGQVVGQSSLAGNAGGESHAFLYDNLTMNDLGTLNGYNSSWAYRVNDHGEVVGWSSEPTSQGGSTNRAFLYSESTLTDIGTLGGSYSQAFGINNDGKIVGSSTTNNGLQRAFLYSNSTMTDLNSLIHPTNSQWTLALGRDINDSSQIAASGDDSHGRQHALLLTPITNVPKSSALVIQVTNDADSPSSTGFSAVVDGRHSGTAVGYDSGIDHDLDTSMSPTDITTAVYSDISGHRVGYNYAPEVGGYYRFCLGCENSTGTDLIDVPNSLTISGFVADSLSPSLDYEYILSVDTDIDGNYDYNQHGLLSDVWASSNNMFGEWTQDIPAGMTLDNYYYGELTLLAIAVPEPSTITLLICTAIAGLLAAMVYKHISHV